MKENPKDIPIEAYDIVDMSQSGREFAGNTTDLYNAMVEYDSNGGAEYLGKLHGFNAVYDGIILSVGHLVMDEMSVESLRYAIFDEDFPDDGDGNRLGKPEQILVRLGTEVEEMWSVPVEFVNWPDHFMNSPDVVFDSLDKLAERLHAYRTKASGFDQMGIIGNKHRDLQGLRALEGGTERLILQRGKTVEIHESGSFDLPSRHRKVDTSPLGDNKISDQQASKRLNPFSKFLGRWARKTS